MKLTPFERFAGLCAILVGASGLAYAASFVVLLDRSPRSADALTNALLIVAGLLSTAVFVGVYNRVRETEPGFALWALVLGVAGAVGSVAHGGFELAKIVNTPPFDPNLPNPTDPRGLFTFGLTALAAFVIAWLVLGGARLPRGLAYLGLLSGVLLLIVFFGRLIVLNPKEKFLLVSALLAGFVVNPLWYLWLGVALWRGGGETRSS